MSVLRVYIIPDRDITVGVTATDVEGKDRKFCDENICNMIGNIFFAILYTVGLVRKS